MTTQMQRDADPDEFHLRTFLGEPVDVDRFTLGDMLREARNFSGLPLSVIADQAGVSASQISRLENGLTKKPSIVTLNAIAAGLMATPEPLIYIATDDERVDPGVGLGARAEVQLEQLLEGRNDRDDPETLRRAARAACWWVFVHGGGEVHVLEDPRRKRILVEVEDALRVMTDYRAEQLRTLVQDLVRLGTLDRRERRNLTDAEVSRLDLFGEWEYARTGARDVSEAAVDGPTQEKRR